MAPPKKDAATKGTQQPTPQQEEESEETSTLSTLTSQIQLLVTQVGNIGKEIGDRKISQAEFAQKRRRRDGDPEIVTWLQLKRLMRQNFVRKSYRNELRNELQDLRQGSRLVWDFYWELVSLRTKLQLDESDESMEARFIRGLNRNLRDPVELHALKVQSLEELVEYADTLEKQTKTRESRAAPTSSRPYSGSTSTKPSPQSSQMRPAPTRTPFQPRRPPTTSTGFPPKPVAKAPPPKAQKEKERRKERALKKPISETSTSSGMVCGEIIQLARGKMMFAERINKCTYSANPFAGKRSLLGQLFTQAKFFTSDDRFGHFIFTLSQVEPSLSGRFCHFLRVFSKRPILPSQEPGRAVSAYRFDVVA
ncbi:OLC1v1012906C1 [Oldenlandia corymbosa var. corymbosa]|uniref:OLC1v1012906C1 n=1 Tax=Oldenlandia corymbosa var. corymbosa TaxID=529605 RepID=A0AAV1E088_OLDCO|nr:OLC1v1012906C1 [Oldenlandia corymbosa var. corymbosa]